MRSRKKDSLDGLITFGAITFKAPENVRNSLKSALSQIDSGDIDVDLGTYQAAKKLVDGGRIGPSWIQKNLDWWESNGASSTDEERQLHGGDGAKAWLEDCKTRLEEREAADEEKAKADLLSYKAESRGNVTDVDEIEGIVSGYFATKNVWDSVGEMIVDGAFKRSVREWGPEGKNRIKTLYQHNPAYLIGRPLELVEDEKGLYHVSKISKTSMGMDVLKLIQDEVITEQSIGYTVLDAERDMDDESRVKLLELKLFEGSFVTWGANEDTPITGLKSLSNPVELVKSMQELISNSERSLRSGEWMTDEVPVMIELQNRKMLSILEMLDGLVDKADSLENAKSITIPPITSKVELSGETDEPESNSDDAAEEILSSIKSAFSFDDGVAEEAKLENELRQAFKSFSFGVGD